MKTKGLPKMKTVIRMFALFVAIAGLASASFVPANSQPSSTHLSVAASGPLPQGTLPGPVPCQLQNTCFVQTASNR